MRKSLLVVSTWLITLASCDVADIPGMFVSDESVNQRYEQSMLWNSTNPIQDIIVPTDSYTVLSMSDSHVGSIENLVTFFEKANEMNATAALMAGDLTSGHAEHFEVYQEQIAKQDSFPTFLSVGNHDLYFDGWKEFYTRFGSSIYHFTITTPSASDLYICLDTGGGTLGTKQLEWLKNVLKNIRPGHRRCILFTHNNLFRLRHTTSTNPNMEEIYVLLDLFVEFEVDAVITGHDHEQYATTFGKTIHITLDALKDGLKNSGYLQMDLSDGEISYRFVYI